NAFNNKFLWIAVGLDFFLHLFILYVPVLATVFSLVPLDLNSWVQMFIVTVIGMILLDIFHLIVGKYFGSNVEKVVVPAS
ncbi:MAG: cation transporting ATPase C-terminal domain-containing protein, partial [Candidatus Hodarchaeales archaeon]